MLPGVPWAGAGQAARLRLASVNSVSLPCFIDGVNAATVHSPASEEATEVCKDEGMKLLTTPKNQKLLGDHLGFVYMEKGSSDRSLSNSH